MISNSGDSPMKKCYVFLSVTLVGFAMVAGCSGFKGFCDRGSVFPTRQPQVTPVQTMYTVTGDECFPGGYMMPPCDPCGSGTSSTVFSEPYRLD